MGKSTINGQFSMAMLVYQRVYGGLYETENLPDRPSQKGKTMDVYQLLKIFQRTVDIDHMNHLFLTFDPPSYVCCFIHEKNPGADVHWTYQRTETHQKRSPQEPPGGGWIHPKQGKDAGTWGCLFN